MKIYSITNQKGGVGKSTTALALGAGLTLKGYKVLFIDLDPQGNLTYSLNATAKGYGSMGILQRTETALEEIQPTASGDLIASTTALTGADMSLTITGKEYRLKEALENIIGYDFCLIDTPPALGILTINALTASDGVIIPAQADIFSLQGIGQLAGTIDTVKRYCNPSLQVLGIALTRYNPRAVLTRELTALMEQTALELHTKLYSSKIRECTALKEAQAMRQSIYEYAPRSNGALDYIALLEEILTAP